MHVSSIPQPLVCPFCSLRQFERTDGKCARCRQPMGFTYLELLLTSSCDFQSETARCAGRLLRALRFRRGLTQAAVASLTGIHRTYLSRSERGKVTPSLVTLLRIAGALGVDKVVLRMRNKYR